MTRALVWKELREQWVVWLALAVAAVGGVVALRPILPQDRFSGEMLVCVLWLGAWGYGLVSGSLLLAGETEEQTQAFLDLLPGTRRRLWRTKAGVGLLLLAAQAALLGAAGYLLFQGQSLFLHPGIGQIGIFVFGVAGYAFGLHGGSRSETVLAAIGRGALAQVVIGLLLFPVIAMAFPWRNAGPVATPNLLGAALLPALVTAGAAFRSREIYCRSDQLRDSARRGPAGRPPLPQWDEAFRLAWWDARWFAAGMAAVSVAVIAALLALGPIAWLISATLMGLVSALSASAADWPGGQRLPAGRRLIVRAAVRLAVAAGALSLTVLVPLVLLSLTEVLQSGDETSLLHSRVLSFRQAFNAFRQLGAFGILPAWLLNGFAVGLLCGLFARSSLTAGLLALPGLGFLGGLLLAVGYVDVVMEGWVWVIPASLLATAAVAMAGRVGAETPNPARRGPWDESFRDVCRETRWFAVGVPVISVLAVVIQADRGGIAWPVTTALIGLVCGLSAAAPERPFEQNPPGGRRLLTRAAVRLAVAVGSSLLTVLVTLVVLEVWTRDLGLGRLRGTSRFLQEEASLLPPGGSLALLPGWLLNGFAVGLLCGLFARGLRTAGLLAVPGTFALGALLLNTKILGEPMNAVQACGVSVLLLTAVALSMRWTRAGGTGAAVLSAAAATLATALWLAAAS